VGQLIVGRPTSKQLVAVSAPLALTSGISLTFRAGAAAEDEAANPGYDRWLIDAWRTLDAGLRHDLELLLGFSGRLMYYVEELLFAFGALEPERLDASFGEYLAFLRGLQPADYQRMVAQALVRIYADRGLTETPPESDDPNVWRMFLRPGVTRANIDEAAALVTSPDQLKRRTLALLTGFWEQCYAVEYERQVESLELAVRYAQALAHPTVQVTFAELTGSRLPYEIEASLGDVERVLYSPAPHLGSFIQYILYRPDLILYFSPSNVLRSRPLAQRAARGESPDLAADAVLDGLKALSDPSRMRIVEMLRDGELYAQEIVARLNISQSAVSRHLSTLEDAGIVSVRPSTGMKYYSIDRARLRALSGHLEALAEVGR
jgi:DNA-binding transcriptional ArsR family regulator